MNFIILIVCVSFLIGLSKGGFGGPIPVAFITPLLSQIMPAAQAVAIVLPLLIVGDLFALRVYWGKWDKQQIWLLLPMAIVGIIIGTALLAGLANQNVLLKRIIGVFSLIVVIYKVGNHYIVRWDYQPRKWHGYLVGGASGIGSALANIGSPPFTAYMLLQNVEPLIFIGTTTLFFAILNIVKLPFALAAGVIQVQQLLSILWALPLIPVGIWIGKRFVLIANPKVFEWVMLVPLFVMGIYMLVVPS